MNKIVTQMSGKITLLDFLPDLVNFINYLFTFGLNVRIISVFISQTSKTYHFYSIIKINNIIIDCKS